MSHPSLARGPAVVLTDGEWHRLHPATPLLRGGIALVAIFFIVFNTEKDNLLQLFLPAPGGGRGDDGRGDSDAGDPVAYVVDHGFIGLALAGIALLILILLAIFYASWRLNTFRVTDETVEVRSGIVFRSNRRARLDRIQGINIQRSLFARVFGAAKLEINQAGHDANVPLAYLGSAAAEDVRREILRRASGARESASERPGGEGGVGLVEQRLHEFLAAPLGEGQVAPQSVVTMHLGRLIGSALLSGFTLFLAAVVAAVVISIATTGQYFLLIVFFPTLLGSFSFYSRRVVKSLRYSIAATPDGIRVGWGLLATSNETLPPGRIHSIRLSQPLLWRPFGWWEVKINRASHSSTKGADGQANTTILPVGSALDVSRVLGLILPELVGLPAVDAALATSPRRASPVLVSLERGETGDARALAAEKPERAVAESRTALSLIEAGMTSSGGDGGFTTSPRRAQWIRWFSWRRNGFRTAPGSILLRKGAIWRQLVVVPLPRVQSVSIRQGPLLRRLRLAAIDLHTVQGPITAQIGALDAGDARVFFESASHDAVVAARADRTHRWFDQQAAGLPWAPPTSDERLPDPSREEHP